jgi:ATP-dependent Clp protease protease subunit
LGSSADDSGALRRSFLLCTNPARALPQRVGDLLMSQRRRMLRAVSRKGSEATIYLDGTIGGKKIGVDDDESISAAAFREQLAAAGDVTTLRIEINCEGGVVTEGMSMYNALRQCKAHKIGIVTGIAASMASVVLMACDEIRVAKGAYIMIHDPSGGARGRAGDLRAAADNLDQMRTDLLDIYEARTGIDRGALEKYLDAETYFTAEEAVEAGIADKVEDFEARINLLAVARLDRKGLPAALRKRVTAKVPLRESLRDLESALYAALRDAYGTEQYPYVVDMFDDSVVFDLNGVLMSRPYTVKDGVVTLGDEATRVVRTYEKVPAALRALAGKGKAKAMKGKKAKMLALEEELARLKAMAAESDDDEPAEEETDEEEETEEETDTEGESATDSTALVATVMALTGAKTAAVATAKIAAMVSAGAAGLAGNRAATVEAMIKGGKLLPSLRKVALAWSEQTLKAYVKSIGGETMLKLGRTHTPPAAPPEPVAAVTQARPGKSPEAVIARQMGVDLTKIKGELPACARKPGEER